MRILDHGFWGFLALALAFPRVVAIGGVFLSFSLLHLSTKKRLTSEFEVS